MMIESVAILAGNRLYDCTVVNGRRVVIDLPVSDNDTSFDIEIKFSADISKFRGHDYRWNDAKSDRISPEYCPKIIQLSNGFFVQPDIQLGVWEFSASQPDKLLWRFNPQNAKPLTAYSATHQKIVESANDSGLPTSVSLLFSDKNAIEFARTPIGFKAVACFTDHCDFDTPESLTLQREFFKSCGIRVTKGFFLNHFSKRKDNASFANHGEELSRWLDDSHELAYHSLSQSIKNDRESRDDFFGFTPPFSDMTTWIDHGYQPYNLSLHRQNNISDTEFARTMTQKNITTLWNYIDSGTATIGVINQLNRNDFTLGAFKKGIAELPWKQQAAMFIKNVMFHYYADEKIIAKYKAVAGNLKRLAFQGKIGEFLPLVRNFSGIIGPVSRITLSWQKHKNTPYKLAKYSPVIFRNTIAGQPFFIFQTIEMVDFKKALHPSNIEKLISESGLFIAHTYFSVPATYHTGKMFSSPTQIDETVANNFSELGKQVAGGNLWNPTLGELVGFLSKFENASLALDDHGNIVVEKAQGLQSRNAN